MKEFCLGHPGKGNSPVVTQSGYCERVVGPKPWVDPQQWPRHSTYQLIDHACGVLACMSGMRVVGASRRGQCASHTATRPGSGVRGI